MGRTDLVATAAALSEDVLLPSASAVDQLDLVPRERLDALADAGLYGIFVPEQMGGLGADADELTDVVELLASGCLTTTLVWVQHFGLLGSLLGAPAALRDAWLPEACRGERRGGIAFGGLLPGPARLTATPDGERWVLRGDAPWVSGWGRIDVLHVAARGPDETIVDVAIDAVEGGGLTATRRRLAAVDASATVQVDLDDLVVGPDRVLGIRPYDPAASLGTGLRLNGSLALGVARRCCALLGAGPLDAELDARRAALDAADDESMPMARAAASAFALRAASALVVQVGSASVGREQDAQRLLREAMFLLVFGSRKPIKDALLGQIVG